MATWVARRSAAVCAFSEVSIGVDRIDPHQSSRDDHAPPSKHARDERRFAANPWIPTRPRIALAHDWLVGTRGGERVLDAIARLLAPRAEIVGLFTMFDNGRPHTPTLDAIPRFVSTMGRVPGALRARRWLLPLYPAAVHDLSRRLAAEHRRAPIDLLISTSSAAIKNLKPPPGVPHLCYCHTPARYLWSRADDYAQGNIGRLRALGLKLFGPSLRRWDKRGSQNVTDFLANSTHIQREIRRVYGRDSTIVFPPVRTDFFVPPPPDSPPRSGWLYVGALEPYKRVHLAIQAAAQEHIPLTIAGRGSELPRLRRLAGAKGATIGGGVTFEPDATDERIRALYQRAQVLIFPQVEDFGIVAVEAQSCGTPVVAFAAGGALDTVKDSVTGTLFHAPSVASIQVASRRVANLAEATTACRQNALAYQEQIFENRILNQIGMTR